MAKAKAWEVTDEFWSRVEPLIPVRRRVADQTCARKPGGGRKPKDPRPVFGGIVFVLHTGCQWKALPAERYGSAGAVHARFLEWEKAGAFEALWKLGLAGHGGFEGIARRWQSIDRAMMKAPPTRRIGRKNGGKRHLLADGCGVPLPLVVTGANRHDVSQPEAVLDAIMVGRTSPPLGGTNTCAPMPAIPEPPPQRSLRSMATSPTSKVEGKKLPDSNEPRRRRLGAEPSKRPTAGSIGFASYWCDTRSSIAAFWH